MPAAQVTIGRRRYAVGLYWENSPGGSVASAAREAARQPGQHAAFFAVRQGNKNGRIPQFGLASETGGFHFGQPVLAACLANQQPGSWAGAFRVREGTVVVVIRDDLIVPDGDQFFVDELEARDRLLQEVGFGGIERIYAPESWGVPGADTLPLSLLLNDRADVTLRPVSVSTRLLLLGVAGALLLSAVLAGGWYYQEQKAQEEAARYARVAAMQKAQMAARKAAPAVVQEQQVLNYPPPEKKWEKRPRPEAVIEACREGLKKVPATMTGWRLVMVKCDGGSINTVWNKIPGYAVMPQNANINEMGTIATINYPLSKLEPRASEDLWGINEITARVLSQNWNARLARVSDDPPPPAPAGMRGKWEPPPSPWVKRSFTLSAPVLPWTLPTFFAGVPGLVVESLSMAGKGSWTVEGVIYESRR